MNKFIDLIKKHFGELKMKWPTVIIFAAITGIYTGIVMVIPFLKNTSFQDIGISYEWWVLFAVVIVVNCEKNYEAMLKCFVFFLISQPLVYAVEILFGTMSFSTALGYYLHIWLPMTFLTLPGGFIAFYCRKQNLLGAVILSLGNTIELVHGLHYTLEAMLNFPHHLLSAIFCVVSVLLMSECIQQKTKYKIASALIAFALMAAVVVVAVKTGRVL